jgi:hypothetical protein
MGIGLCVAYPGVFGYTNESKMNLSLGISGAFAEWLGINQARPNGLFDIPLKLDDSGTTSVVEANDEALQDFWTIAQRLRDTYLKDES